MDRHKSRHDEPRRSGGVGGRLKQRLARILLHSSCTASAAATFVTHNSASSRESPAAHSAAGAGPFCSHQARPVDRRRRRGRSTSPRALVHASIVDECSGHSAATASCALRSVLRSSPMPVKGSGVLREEMMMSRRRHRSGNGERPPRSPSCRYSCSSSSTLTDDDELSYGERRRSAQTRSTTLFSSRSRSFSSDSTSDFYTSTRRPRHHRRKPPRGAFRGAAGGGVAVVKRSRDPYADFRSSMVEMVAERRIRSADGMKELLVPYLSLNSPRHHPAILAAFEAVWEAVLDLQQASPDRSLAPCTCTSAC